MIYEIKIFWCKKYLQRLFEEKISTTIEEILPFSFFIMNSLRPHLRKILQEILSLSGWIWFKQQLVYTAVILASLLKEASFEDLQSKIESNSSP